MSGVVSSGRWGLSKLRLGNLSRPKSHLCCWWWQGGQRSDQYSGWFGGIGYHTRGSSLAAEHGNMSAAATTCFLRSKGSDRSQGRRIYATNLCNRDDFFQASEVWWEKASHDCWDMVKVLVKMSWQWTLTRCLQNNIFGNNIKRP